MTTRIYKSSDASAPVMNVSAGSLLSVLDACLVTGYGAKTAAGWAKTVIDAGTYQAAYTQGVKSGFAQRLLYVKDDATYPGNATAWACSACTVSATPVLTNYFWDQNSTSIGVIAKADQNNGAPAAWMVIANERSAVILIKRSTWGTRGWQMTFVGDLDTPFPNDQGAFSVAGFNMAQGALTMAMGPRGWNNGKIGVYGGPNGAFAFTSYTMSKQLGTVTNVADNVPVRASDYAGVQLTKMHITDTNRYRGALPLMYVPLHPALALPFYAFPDELEFAGSGEDTGTTFKHIQFDPATQDRVFIEVAGFSV